MSVQTNQQVSAPAQPVLGERKLSPGRWARELGWRHIVGVVAVLYAAFPLIYVISTSLSAPETRLLTSNRLFNTVTTASYEALSNDTMFWSWFKNTMVISIVTGIGTVLMGAAAAYAFSRFRFTGRRVGLTSLLVIQMFPQMLAFVAVFLLVLSLDNVVPLLGLNSQLTVIAVYLGGALGVNTFLMYGFFNTVPREIDEAAKIDGASHAQIYWTIILRLVAPILAVVGLLSFIGTFGEFIIARVILQSESQWTLAMGLYNMVSDRLDANWSVFAAGAVIAAIPVLALFLFLQKYIVGGLTAGATKG